MKSNRYLINSVLRAAQILESFSMEKTSYTNAELSKKLGINKSSVTRLLRSLETAGFLEKDPATGGHSLSVKLFRIGSVYLSKVDIHEAAMPHLTELASQFNETAHLAVLYDNEVFFIDRVESHRSIRMESMVGSRLPVHCTAIGKLLLAHQDEKFLNQYLRSVDLKRYTPNTITEDKEFRDHLQEIRDRGYSIDDIEHEPELKSTAAPVRDHTGKVIAGISVAGPAYRMQDDELFERIIRAVIETADRISERLGYAGE